MTDFQEVLNRLSECGERIGDAEMAQLHLEAARHLDAALKYRSEGNDRKACNELEIADYRLDALEDVAGYRKRREGQGQV